MKKTIVSAVLILTLFFPFLSSAAQSREEIQKKVDVLLIAVRNLRILLEQFKVSQGDIIMKTEKIAKQKKGQEKSQQVPMFIPPVEEPKRPTSANYYPGGGGGGGGATVNYATE